MGRLISTSFLLVLTIAVLSCTSSSSSLSVSPSKVDFGDVYINEISDTTLTLKNKYGKDIVITQILIAGPADFIVKSGNAVPISLSKNAEHIVEISFNPQSAGKIEAELEIVHSGSTKAKFVHLSGTGVAAPKISLSETNYDLGKKTTYKTHDHDFVIENTGSADLNISSMTFNGSGASVYSITSGAAPILIQPMAKHTFTVTFAPPSVGTFSADLAIIHDAYNEISPVVINLTGEGIDVDPQITFSIGNSWDFGSVAKTLPSTQICEIENTGSDPLTVTSATMTTGTEFAIDSLTDSNGNPLNFPQTIAVGAIINLYVKFSPTANATFNDTLTFNHDGTNEVNPWDIPLTGVGRDEVSQTFIYTGSAQQWTVPAGVTSIYAMCYGAEGGTNSSSAGGKGGEAIATIPVVPGETLSIYVGGKGTLELAAPNGGWNGGGGTNAYGSGYAGTGGGASDIRRGAGLSDRLLVAGGGGGGGAHQSSLPGGDGGGLTGSNGVNWSSWPDAHGKGGTQTTGGIAGTFTGYSALPGTFGEGGRGRGDNAGGGGGGGGWYGGGGGVFSGAGGGSSYYDAVGNTNKSTNTGVRSGNGEIVIKY